MASTGIFNGSTYTVKFETDGTPVVTADHVTDLSVSVSTETRDTTSKNNGGYRALLPGLKSLSVNFTAFYAQDASNGYNELMTDFLAGAKQDVSINAVDWDNAGADIVGDQEIVFEAYITSLELSAGTEDNASYTCTLECVSAITFQAQS